MAGIGGVLDIVKIRKTGSKTGQNRFRIFPTAFFNSLGQDGSNGTPFEAVVSISISACLKCTKTVGVIYEPSLLHKVPIVRED